MLVRSHSCIQSVFKVFQPHPVCERVSMTLQVGVATGEIVWAGESHLSSWTHWNAGALCLCSGWVRIMRETWSYHSNVKNHKSCWAKCFGNVKWCFSTVLIASINFSSFPPLSPPFILKNSYLSHWWSLHDGHPSNCQVVMPLVMMWCNDRKCILHSGICQNKYILPQHNVCSIVISMLQRWGSQWSCLSWQVWILDQSHLLMGEQTNPSAKFQDFVVHAAAGSWVCSWVLLTSCFC